MTVVRTFPFYDVGLLGRNCMPVQFAESTGLRARRNPGDTLGHRKLFHGLLFRRPAFANPLPSQSSVNSLRRGSPLAPNNAALPWPAAFASGTPSLRRVCCEPGLIFSSQPREIRACRLSRFSSTNGALEV